MELNRGKHWSHDLVVNKSRYVEVSATVDIRPPKTRSKVVMTRDTL